MLRFIFSTTIALFFLSIMNSACKDRNCPDILKYQIPYSATPVRDTFHIGDTIRIEMNFNDHLTDLNGGIENTFPNFDFQLQLLSDRFDIDPPESKAVSFMDVFPMAGEVIPRALPSSGVSYYDVLPVYKDGFYHFECQVVLKQPGSFTFTLSPYVDDMIAPFKVNGNCDDLPLRITSKVNDGDPVKNNYHLLKSSPIPVYRNMTLERFGQSGFCFVVKS